jgi:hypothetical protein
MKAFALVLMALTVLQMQGSLSAGFILSDSASMSDLLAGDSLLASGTEFSDWTLNNALATGGALPIDPAAVTVQAGNDGDQVGLRFLLGAAVGPGQTADLDFTYKVSSGTPLANVGSLLDGAATNGTGVVSLAETLFVTFPGTPVGSLSVSTLNTASLSDETALDPARGMIVVRKDLVLTGGTAGTGSISSFFQLYQQVPEPTTAFNLMIALTVGLGWTRRRLG